MAIINGVKKPGVVENVSEEELKRRAEEIPNLHGKPH
jgi:hypothetical protein